jgi:hypothetical protein
MDGLHNQPFVMPRYERTPGWKQRMESDWKSSDERAKVLSTMSASEIKRRRFD